VTSTLIRRSSLLLLAAALPLAVAAPAGAEVPEGWSDPDDVSLLQLLVVTIGIPAVLLVAIVLAVLLPSLARGEKLRTSSGSTEEWFGGPRHQAGELEASTSGRTTGTTGGASGSW
jgi:hypothetical protein